MNLIFAVLLILIVLAALGGPIGWYGPNWQGGPYYYGGFGIVVVVIVILLIMALLGRL